MDWMSNLWSGVSDFATNAFDWIGNNPEAANIIGGVAMGAAQGYMQQRQAKEQRVFDREMYERSVRDRRKDREITPGEINNYGSHLNTMTQGLLSHGMIAGQGH